MSRKSVRFQTETAVSACRVVDQAAQSNNTEAIDVSEFCMRNKIGKSSYYYLQILGRAPKTTRVGRRVIIFPEDEANWRRSIQENPLPEALRPAAQALLAMEAA